MIKITDSKKEKINEIIKTAKSLNIKYIGQSTALDILRAAENSKLAKLPAEALLLGDNDIFEQLISDFPLWDEKRVNRIISTIPEKQEPYQYFMALSIPKVGKSRAKKIAEIFDNEDTSKSLKRAAIKVIRNRKMTLYYYNDGINQKIKEAVENHLNKKDVAKRIIAGISYIKFK